MMAVEVDPEDSVVCTPVSLVNVAARAWGLAWVGERKDRLDLDTCW